MSPSLRTPLVKLEDFFIELADFVFALGESFLKLDDF